MESGLVKLPPNLELQGSNVSVEWKFWKTSFEDYLMATIHDQSSDKIKLPLLINMIGSEAARLVTTVPISEKDNQKYDNVIEAIVKFVSTRVNIVLEIYLFNASVQSTGETFEQFFHRLLTFVKKL